MVNKINIEGIELYAYHGRLDEEGKIGGNYIVDVYMEVNFLNAALKDDLNLTIDYCNIYEISKKQMAIRSKLIEDVCLRIYNEIKDTFPSLNNLHVKVTKLLPPMNGNVKNVSVEIKT